MTEKLDIARADPEGQGGPGASEEAVATVPAAAEIKGATTAIVAFNQKLSRFAVLLWQWVFWAGLALVITALFVDASREVGIGDPPLVPFWVGVALFSMVILLHFPPVFFWLPKGRKRIAYIAFLPCFLGGVVCFALVSQAFQRSPEGAPARAEAVASAEATIPAELKTICAKMQTASTGQPEATIAVDVIDTSTATLSYVRDDGKSFRYDCRVIGDRVEHRMHDERGPGTLGDWRRNIWHTWERRGGQIVVTEHTSFE